MPRRPTDSRDYVTPFGVSTAADAPRDFRLPAGLAAEFTGLFLPRDGGVFGPRGSPPSLLIVSGGVLWVLTRQSADRVRIPLPRLETLECGRLLLLGWIALHWDGHRRELRYNRREAAPVEWFLAEIKASWFAGVFAAPDRDARSFGMQPALKFRHARSIELLPGETPLIEIYDAPARTTVRRFGFRREIRPPGNLLLLTDRRILWIGDGYRSISDPYGTVSRSAPLSAVEALRLCRLDGGAAIEIVMHSGKLWRVSLKEAQEHSVRAFADAVARRAGGAACSNALP
ncbi:MAG: hypothetical protein KIT09_09760 [Bryobacteraceae bacterium]|nr:hypothetical protein [Bryobacteraceae bacterium]